MRRVVSIFKKKKASSKQQEQSNPRDSDDAQGIPPQPRRTVLSSRIGLSSTEGSERVNSSSSASSAGSFSLRTPDDEHVLAANPAMMATDSMKKRSMSWLSRRKSTNVSARQVPLEEWEPPDVPQLTAPAPRPPPMPQQQQQSSSWSRLPAPPTLPALNLGSREGSEEDEPSEDSEEDNDDDEDEPLQAKRRSIQPPVVANATNVAGARKNIRACTLNGMQRQQQQNTPPPLSIVSPGSGSPLFPRSCNAPRTLVPEQTLHSTLLKRRCLHRLDHETLSRSQELSILPFSQRPTASVVPRRAPQPAVYDRFDATSAWPDGSRVSNVSHGLKRWYARPCFEDRFSVWLATADAMGQNVIETRVQGGALGVAALEYSEALEALAGLLFDEPAAEAEAEVQVAPTSPTPSMPPTSLRPSTTQPTTVAPPLHTNSERRPASSLQLPAIPLSRPLVLDSSVSGASHRSGSAPAVSKMAPATLPARDRAPVASAASAPQPPLKRGVHFAEDDKDDSVPLGDVVRIRKGREEKQRFLREQRERRLFEEEKKRVEAERMQREKQRLEWEQERRAWEKERRQQEDEKKTRRYAEEVIATRARRDSQRIGFMPGRVDSSSSLTSTRERSDSNSRSKRDSQYTSSVNSSRPPSIFSNTPAGGSMRGSIYGPPSASSAYMSSHEDLRQSRSYSPTNTQRPTPDRANTWAGQMAPVMTVPIMTVPVLTMPQMYAGMDSMPLLPPTAPFMMQQTGNRGRSNTHSHSGGSNSSASRSPARNSSNRSSTSSLQLRRDGSSSSITQSSESYRHQRVDSQGRKIGQPSSDSVSSTMRPGHQRRGSDHSGSLTARARHAPPSKAPSSRAPQPSSSQQSFTYVSNSSWGYGNVTASGASRSGARQSVIN